MIASYSQDMVLVALDTVPITGFAPGEYLTIEFSGEEVKASQGSHGAVSISKLENNLGTMKLVLQSASTSNATLWTMAQTSRATSILKHTVTVKDLLGNILVTGTAWFQKVPAIKLGEERGDQEWTLGGVFTFSVQPPTYV
jgi:hypothetical protein